MKLKTFASLSGKITRIEHNIAILVPNFNHDARIYINLNNPKYSLLQPGDDVIVTGEIELHNSRQICITPDCIARQEKGKYRDVNSISITARSKNVSYSMTTDDLFHADFESGILSITRISFKIDRSKLEPEELRDFARGNQLRPYCISGKLNFEQNKLQLLASSIARA